ncbi:MAG TPA: MurR/RpiR family transcriptional regulator [Paraburkholderia sp.]
MSASSLTWSERPPTAEQFLQRVALEYEMLSNRLKLIARYVECNSEQIGLESVQSLAERCGVNPSTIVRFAQRFGFSGFSELRSLFRERLTREVSFSDDNRLPLSRSVGCLATKPQGQDRVAKHISGSIEAMKRLWRALDQEALASAANVLAAAQTIWIVGSGRSFPIAVYLEYMLQYTEKCVGLFSGLGGTHLAKVRSVRRGDVLVAISLAPNDDELLRVVQQAAQRGASVLAISDSRLSPVAQSAQLSLIGQETASPGPTGITATTALVESLLVELNFQLGLSAHPG